MSRRKAELWRASEDLICISWWILWFGGVVKMFVRMWSYSWRTSRPFIKNGKYSVMETIHRMKDSGLELLTQSAGKPDTLQTLREVAGPSTSASTRSLLPLSNGRFMRKTCAAHPKVCNADIPVGELEISPVGKPALLEQLRHAGAEGAAEFVQFVRLQREHHPGGVEPATGH